MLSTTARVAPSHHARHACIPEEGKSRCRGKREVGYEGRKVASMEGVIGWC
jgi:hypothetical protein